jgi:hypothetical protein
MATYKEMFFRTYANSRGNIRKGVKASQIWQSVEEFLRLVLDPKQNKPPVIRKPKENAKNAQTKKADSK